MKLVSFSVGGGDITPGVLRADEKKIVSLAPLGFASTLDAIKGSFRIDTTDYFEVDEVKFHAPLPNPPRVFAIGLNYRDHAAESKMALPKVPVVFFKMNTAIIGPGEKIVLPKNSTQPDYEAELAFVIGKGGYRIPSSAWREHVYGYTMVNDVSARDVQRATSQWSLGKSFPTFAPMGPWVVSKDEIADPHRLGISMTIGGERLQDANTSQMIYQIPALIEYLSSIVPLQVGDVISTGTPAGVGMGRTPQRWLKAGDEMVVSIEGIGELRNAVVGE